MIFLTAAPSETSVVCQTMQQRGSMDITVNTKERHTERLFYRGQ